MTGAPFRAPIATISTHENFMNATRLIGIILLVGGILAISFGGFSFTRDSTVAKVGPIELTAKRKEDVNIPMWAGIGAIVVGAVLVVVGKK
jgi:uncharacterized membrane protein